MQDLPDFVVVERAQDGDETAWIELIRRAGPVIERAVAGLFRNPADRDELRQETFSHLLGSLKRFDPGRGDLAGWAWRTARNLALSRLKRLSRLGIHRAALEAKLLAETATDRDTDGEDARERVRRLMVLLGPGRKAEICRLLAEGLTAKEAASRLGIGYATVRKYLTEIRSQAAQMEEMIRPREG